MHVHQELDVRFLRRNWLFRLLAVVVALLATAGAWAATELLRNIDSTVIARGSNPRMLGRIGSNVYFGVTDTPANRNAIWRTDGTPSGTVEMRELDRIANFNGQIAVGSRLIMSAYDNGVARLWSTDGTGPGTVEIGPSSITFGPDALGVLADGRVVFQVRAGTTASMWVSDGTPSGTTLLLSPSNHIQMRTTNTWSTDAVIYYTGGDGTTGVELWRTDGTVAGTRLVRDVDPGPPSPELEFLGRAGDFVYFRATTIDDGTELWRVDIRTDVAELFADLSPGPGSSIVTDVEALTGNRFVLQVGSDLFASSGTRGNLQRLNDASTSLPANSLGMLATAGRVVFAAENPATGIELWSTDGTPAGTVLLRDHTPGTDGASINLIDRLDRGLVLSLWDRDAAEEIWRTDGTVAGTVRLAPSDTAVIGANSVVFRSPSNDARLWRVDRNTGASQVSNISVGLEIGFDSPRIGNRIIVRGFDSTRGTEPWVTDGTLAGTMILRDIVPQTQNQSASVQQLTTLGNSAYFAARTDATGLELWRSEGPSGETRLLIDILPGMPGSDLSRLTAIGNRLFFIANDGRHDYEPWVSDGTTSGTRMLRDIAPSGSSIFPSSPSDGCSDWIAASGGFVYLNLADNGFRGTQLWRTDGTEAGTRKVADLSEGRTVTHGICQLFGHGSYVYFSFGDAVTGTELYRSDGTASGTTLLRDIDPGSNGSAPSQFTAFRGYVYFIAARSATSRTSELWRTDGTVNGTQQVHGLDVSLIGGAPGSSQIVGVVNDRLVFVGSAGTQARLIATDGTAAGTTVLSSTIAPTASGTLSGDLLYFPCNDLCVTDGTAAGTLRLKEMSAGTPSGIGAFHLLNLNGALYFQSQRNANEFAVWKTNGTVASTVPAGTARIAATDTMAIAGARVLFAGFDDENGTELWQATSLAPAAANDAVTIAAGSSIVLSLTSNDADADGAINSNSLRLASQPANGTATANANGTVRYVPNPGFSGTDSFRYRVSDEFGIESNEAIVTINVTGSPPPGGASGGGGSMTPITLAMLGWVLFWSGFRTLHGRHVAAPGAPQGKVMPA
jgi:ELWxxDGT repeat protein